MDLTFAFYDFRYGFVHLNRFKTNRVFNVTTYNNDIAQFGSGIFSVKDISILISKPTATVNRWLKEFWDKKFSTQFGKYYFGEKGSRAVNFFTLIEFITFSKLRENGISAQKIQKFHNELSKALNTKYPFAETKLLTDKKDVWFEHLDNLVKIDGKKQFAFSKIIEPYLSKIEFDENSVARRFYPDGKSSSVVIDPKHQFGEPTIKGTNIKADIIFRLYKIGESKEAICKQYNLSSKEVEDSIRFCKKIAA